MRRIARATYHAGVILLFVLVAIAGFTQTRAFKSYLRDQILDQASKVLLADLSIGSVDGNLITGFVLHDVHLSISGESVVSSERAEIRYDPIAIPFQRIALGSAVLIRPRISIWRGMDGVWNVERIALSTPKDSSESPWTLDLRSVRCEDASISIIDSLRLAERSTAAEPPLAAGAIDYARIRLDSVQLAAAAQIARGNIYVQVQELSFHSSEPDFALHRFQADLALTKTEARIGRLVIRTAGTDLELQAALRRADLRKISSLAEIAKSPVELDLNASRLDTRELKQILHSSVDFLDSTYAIRIEANGTVGELDVTRLTINAGESAVDLEGRLLHLDHAEDLYLDATGSQNRFDPVGIRSFLPGLDLPDLGYLGRIHLGVKFVGRLDDFRAEATTDCGVGGADVAGTLRIENGKLIYKTTTTLRNVDLFPLTDAERLDSRLNGTIQFEGTGTRLSEMASVARLELDSSVVHGIPLRRSVVVASVSRGLLRAHGQIRYGQNMFDLTGRYQLGTNDSSSYGLDGTVHSLSLGDALDRNSLPSDLSFTLHAEGFSSEGNGRDSVKLGFFPSIIGNEPFPEADASILYERRARGPQTLTVRSPFCDVDVSGTFGILSLYSQVERSVRMSIATVKAYVSDLDSIRGVLPAVPRNPMAAVSKDTTFTDFRFRMFGKTMSTLGVLLYEPMEGRVLIEGSVRNVNGTLSIEATGQTTEYVWAFTRDTLILLDTKSTVRLTGDPASGTLPQGDFVWDGRAMSMRLALFTSPHGEMTIRGDSGEFKASALIDSTVHVDGSGTADLRRGILSMRFDRLALSMGEYALASELPFVLKRGIDGFSVENAQFSNESEEVRVNGIFDPAGQSDIRFDVNNFLLTHLDPMLKGKTSTEALRRYGGIVDGSGMFRGTFEDPQFDVSLRAEGMRVRQQVLTADGIAERDALLGSVEGRMNYRNLQLDLFLQLTHSPEDTTKAPDVLLRGSVPFDLTIGSERKHDLTGDIDVALISQGLNMEVLDPFIPEITGLTGRMTCNMRMRGAVDAPQYEGSMMIRNARFLFEPVELRYILDADLIAAGERIELKNSSIRNIPEDVAGDVRMNVGGSFRMFGLRFRDFDLMGNGQLLVMNSETRQSGQSFFGRLIVGSGSRGLSWTGNLDASLFKGDMTVRSASLTFPPEREARAVRSGSIGVTFRDDTSRAVPVIPDEAGRKSRLATLGSSLGNEIRNGNPGQQRRFIDGISYDLSLQTQGATQLRLVFNTQTSEELFADLRGSLYFFRIPEVVRLTGSVEVSNRSYYNFIKKFEVVEGRLLYTGDPLNPELDIAAKYEADHRVKSTGANTLAPEKVEKVQVNLTITGTRNEPKPKMGLVVDEKERNTGDEESDAISFILSGQYRDELTDQQRTGLIGTNLSFGLASGMLTGPLSDFFRRKTGVIQSVDVLYYGGGTFEQSADVRLTGQIGETVVRIGGRVLNDPSNLNASVEVPMSSLTGNDKLRNLIFTLERRVEGIENMDERRRSSNGARIFYRISF